MDSFVGLQDFQGCLNSKDQINARDGIKTKKLAYPIIVPFLTFFCLIKFFSEYALFFISAILQLA